MKWSAAAKRERDAIASIFVGAEQVTKRAEELARTDHVRLHGPVVLKRHWAQARYEYTYGKEE